jgi:hypothetical protein
LSAEGVAGNITPDETGGPYFSFPERSALVFPKRFHSAIIFELEKISPEKNVKQPTLPKTTWIFADASTLRR